MNKEKIKLTANILFSGIGAQERGFRNSGLFNVDIINTSEIDKEAVVSYAAIHCGLTNDMIENYPNYPARDEMVNYLTRLNLGYNPDKDKNYDWSKLAKRKNKDIEKYYLACKLSSNAGDIHNIKALAYADFWTCSFPCTDISVAGKREGLSPDSNTRSSLLWESIRLLKTSKDLGTLPKYIMFENVKNLVGKKFINDFHSLLDILDDIGFNTYWKVINGKDCGIPQNRERVFAVSIRKDIDSGKMDFPQPFDNGLRLIDFLEEAVDEKYYLSEKVQERFKVTDDSFSKSIIGSTKPEGSTRKGERDVVYNQNNIIGALCGTDYKQPKQVLETKKTNNEIDVLGLLPIKGKDQIRRVYNTKNISPTLGAVKSGNQQPKILEHLSYKIRKLTPTEAWLLMGFTKEDVNKCKSIGISDTALYKQAGNSIITNCVELIAEHLYKAQYDNSFICFDENFANIENTFLNKPKLIGGIGEINYGKQFRQGNRVYDSSNVGMAIQSSPVDNAGGNSYLYAVKTKYSIEQNDKNFTKPQTE